MIVSGYLDTKPNQELPGVVKREVINADDGAPNFCMRVFELEPASSTPSHSHWWEHEVFVLSGRGVVVGEQGETQIAKDSVVFVPLDEHHCFINSGGETLRFICVMPFTDQDLGVGNLMPFICSVSLALSHLDLATAEVREYLAIAHFHT